MKNITDIKDLSGKKVLVRADFNVSLGDNGIIDENESLRIRAGLRTLQFLSEQGAKVIVISHIGREPDESLRNVAEYINDELETNIGFVPEVTGENVKNIVADLNDGEMVLLENLRSQAGEIENDPSFAEELASLADIYVNDGFSVSHREHASIVGLPKLLPSYVGIQFSQEVKHLDVVRNPKQPLVVVMGGAKFGTKLELMQKFLPNAETIIVGGALANRLYKDQGLNIGTSLVDDEGYTADLVNNDEVVLPQTVITQSGHKLVTDVQAEDSIMDVDVAEFAHTIKNAQTILWNGPMGYYEGGYTKGTIDLAHMIAESSATSVVGGGDTVTALYDENILDKFTFASMAGGAMLDYLVDGTLPGIEAL
jgi:3-phosphoglycerate kinase